MLTLIKLNKYIIKKTNFKPCKHINQLLYGITWKSDYNEKYIYLIRKNKPILSVSLYFDRFGMRLNIHITGYHSFKKIYDSDNFFETNSRKLWNLIDIIMDAFDYDEDSYDIATCKDQWITISGVKDIYDNVLN